MLRVIAPLFALSLVGCVSTGMPRGVPASTPRYDALMFFDGHQSGDGVLKVVMRKAVEMRVEGRGQRSGDTLVLVQQVVEGDKPERRRNWKLTRVAPDRWEGTLSDATGPVVATANGNTLSIDYDSDEGAVHQTIMLEPGGRVAQNHLTVRKLGIVVAVLDETIRKLD